MKSSLKKLRGFTKHKNDSKDKRDFNSSTAQQDELAQASEDMQDMRNCYDSLLSAAAATANSAYEFSESLREMGACLLEKTALNDDEESGRVLLMLGKVQFELQKLVDSYRSHIFQTITTPSESLLNELRTVEEMKRQCDEKRNVYEYMTAAKREKGRSRSSKGESFSSQQLQAAHEEYDEEATLFVFRLKSLRQGQSRSLLTQAARHHAAQLNFFRKGLKSLEGVEPHLKLVTEQQHIEYQFSELEDDDGEDDDDDGNATNDDGELSFDYGQNDHVHDVISASRNSMEVDQVDLSFPRVSTAEVAQENPDKSSGELPIYSSPKAGSFSAPLFAEKKFDAADRIKQMRPSSSRKFSTYVLPTPVDAKNSIPVGSDNQLSRSRNTNLNHNLWHSSPLEPKKHEKDYRDDKLLGRTNLKSQSILKESNINNTAIKLPSPSGDRFSLPQLDPRIADSKKIKRQAFSGPITSKPWSTRPMSSASGPIAPMDHPQLVSGVLPRVAVPRSSPPRVSPSASPPPISSPKISELHELPRPPAASTRPLGLIGHSAPLLPRNQDSTATARHSSSSPSAASPLPIPPTVTRSYSIPSSSQKAMALHVSKQLEPQNAQRTEDVSSPPLTPISIAKIRPSISSEDITRPGQNRGEE